MRDIEDMNQCGITRVTRANPVPKYIRIIYLFISQKMVFFVQTRDNRVTAVRL